MSENTCRLATMNLCEYLGIFVVAKLKSIQVQILFMWQFVTLYYSWLSDLIS